MAKIIFIIGVNGVGKSSIIPILKQKVNNNQCEVHDFDERGVSDNADKIWRQNETNFWINFGKKNLTQDITTIICGFVKPIELNQIASINDIIPIVILLHGDNVNIQSRMLSRYTNNESIIELFRTTGKNIEKFTQDNIWISQQFKTDCLNLGYNIVDTSNRSIEEVAALVLNILKKPSNMQ
jgi:broad-specificity NMP kinase